MKLENIDPISRFFALFVGESGSGKTCASLSFPKPLYVIDLDNRIRGGIAAKKWLGNLDGIEYDNFKNYTDIDLKLEKLVQEYNRTGKFPYRTIVFDSITSGSRAYVQEGVELTKKGDTSDANASPRRFGRVYLPGWNAYNYESTAHYNVLLAYLKNFPCHVVVSGHKADKFDKKGEKIGSELLGRPKIAAEIPTYFDEVYEFDKDYNDIKQVARYTVTMRGEIAKTAFVKAPFGKIDITEQSFFGYLQTLSDSKVV